MEGIAAALNSQESLPRQRLYIRREMQVLKEGETRRKIAGKIYFHVARYNAQRLGSLYHKCIAAIIGASCTLTGILRSSEIFSRLW